MKVLFAASECVPFVKTGGLADVVGTLPAALQSPETDVRIILPNYAQIPVQWREQMRLIASFEVQLGWRKQYCGILELQYRGVTVYFVDNLFYFAREGIYTQGDFECERFAFFCRAVLEALPRIGFFPDVLHCHDWQTGMIPALLKLQYQNKPDYRSIRTLYTIHNLRYQGIFPWEYAKDLLSLSDEYFTSEQLEFYGCINFMKGALLYADRINTVSPTYADEIKTPQYGERLEGMLCVREKDLCGIVNGIDTDFYNPAADPFIAAPYDTNDRAGKAVCKQSLQEQCGLPVNKDIPVIGIVSRLADQKGIDLIAHVLDELLQLDLQMVVLGCGEARYEELFRSAQQRYPDKLAIRTELNEAFAHCVYAGSDLFLMPSLFEPCGLSQMIALRYGAVPIVRQTGGLYDTVVPYHRDSYHSTGFGFSNYNAHDMLFTIKDALHLYQQDKASFAKLTRRSMQADWSWQASAKQYLILYKSICWNALME